MKFKCDMVGGIDNHFGEYPGKVLICVDSINDVVVQDYSTYDKKVYLQIEPPEITNTSMFAYICQNHGLFDLILTWHKELAKLPNAVLFPFGDCWTNYADTAPMTKQNVHNVEYSVGDKEKAVSFICTDKQMTYGHTLRHQIWNTFLKHSDHKGLPLDFIMTPPRVEKKDIMFDKFQFAIVMENCIHDNWFSEKLVDCIAKRTIPIYYGPQNIGKYFNLQGMYRFYDLPGLIEILDSIVTSDDAFTRCVMAADDNWDRCERAGFFQDKNLYRRVDEKIMELYR